MIKKNINTINEYIITIILSLSIAVAIGLVVELELLFRSEDYVNSNELNVENLSEFFTIEQLEKKLVESPEDVLVNLRLAKMYESLNLLEKANEFYKNSLRYSSRSDYALYCYAIFCAKHNLYAHAANLAEELSINNDKSNLYKAKIYEQIALGLSNEKNYLASAKSYQIAYKYAKSMKNPSYLSYIKDLYSKDLIKLADYNVDNNEFDEAIVNLKNSIKIKDTPLANYKLGLIYVDANPKKAEKYISKAFYKDNFLVNPYIYNSLLQKLMDSAREQSQNSVFNHYNSKLSRFKQKVSDVYLYKDELSIDNSFILTKKNIFNNVKNILAFNIKNLKNEPINNLFIKAEFYLNGNVYEIEKKVISPTNFLDGYDDFTCQDLVLPDGIKFDDIKKNNDIFVRYYAKKVQEAPWVLVKIDFINI